MGTYKPGDSYYGFFGMQHSVTRVLSNADATPTSTVYHNGTSDASFSITVTGIATGIYRMTGLIPVAYSAGDKVNILSSGAVSGIVGAAQVDAFVLDSKRAADYVDTNGRVDVINIGGTAATSVLETRVANVLNTSVPTNFHLLSIDTNGRVDVTGILGINASSAISSIVGDATVTIDVPANFTSLDIDSSGWVTVGKIEGLDATDAIDIQVSSQFDIPVNFTSLEIDSNGHVRAGRAYGTVELDPI